MIFLTGRYGEDEGILLNVSDKGLSIHWRADDYDITLPIDEARALLAWLKNELGDVV